MEESICVCRDLKNILESEGLKTTLLKANRKPPNKFKLVAEMLRNNLKIIYRRADKAKNNVFLNPQDVNQNLQLVLDGWSIFTQLKKKIALNHPKLT